MIRAIQLLVSNCCDLWNTKCDKCGAIIEGGSKITRRNNEDDKINYLE
jgi:hypothetical protein